MGDITTVSLLVVLGIGTAVGAFAGMVFGNAMDPNALLAVLSGLAGTLAAAVSRNALVELGFGVGEFEQALPTPVFIFAIIASIIGSLAGFEVAALSSALLPVYIGALAGLLSSILTALLVISYHMPGQK
ncbi:hypothetical protein [Hyphomicrobium sp. ghe19]|uniref:hypothetical protein n=1 Tax=Hyphomicrobium sp. ghe19 TaxID=2682968 RepID=UPI001366E2FA|nr:hypothetical protein HYPP_04413 [Hyphomicrobium sp. ghe19]